MPELEVVSRSACFGGETRFLRHASRSTRTEMEFSVFLPPQLAAGPVDRLRFELWIERYHASIRPTKGRFPVSEAKRTHGGALLRIAWWPTATNRFRTGRVRDQA